MKRKITGIFLLFVLIAPVAVTFTWLQLEKTRVKKSVKRHIIHSVKKEELVLLKFTQAQTETELDWEHSKEFEWRENMYDIVERETHGDTLYFWCWLDDDETQLNRRISALLTNVWEKDEEKKEREQRLLKFYKSLFLAENEEMNCAIWPNHEVDFTRFNSKVKIRNGQPPTPPPQA